MRRGENFMRVLAIDTALAACAAAVLDSRRGEVLAVESRAMLRGHAEELMPLLARVMDRSGLEFAELDRIVVTVGPGSFTGLRVGIAAARAIALASGKPAVGLSTLSAFAAPHIAAGRGVAVVSAIDARNDNVYLQVFGPGGQTLAGPALVGLREAVAAGAGETAILTGSGAAKLVERGPQGVPPPQAVDDIAAPDIVWIARLGAVAPDPVAPPRPLYLRRPDARPQADAHLPRR